MSSINSDVVDEPNRNFLSYIITWGSQIYNILTPKKAIKLFCILLFCHLKSNFGDQNNELKKDKFLQTNKLYVYVTITINFNILQPIYRDTNGEHNAHYMQTQF